MGVIRRVYRHLLDRELGVLGGELEAAEARIDDDARKLASLQDRFERLVNRVTMRVARSGRDDAEHDRQILTEIKRRAQGERGVSGDPFGPDPWQH